MAKTIADSMEIVLGDRPRRMGVTLESILTHPDIKYFFYTTYYKNGKEVAPKLDSSKLYIQYSKCDMFFFMKLQEVTCALCGQPEGSFNVKVDLNADTILVD